MFLTEAGASILPAFKEIVSRVLNTWDLLNSIRSPVMKKDFLILDRIIIIFLTLSCQGDSLLRMVGDTMIVLVISVVLLLLVDISFILLGPGIAPD